jgi:nitrile hydratase subunit beta
MKLQHYIGGLEGLPGPLTLDRRVFAAEWEKRIFGIHVAMMGLSDHLRSALPSYQMSKVSTTFRDTWTWADLRSGAEAMDPFDYFKFRYYEKWLGGITAFLVENGYLSEEELAARTTELHDQPALRAADRMATDGAAPDVDDQVMTYLRCGDSPRRDVAHPKFAVGQQVRVVNVHTDAHTRLPGYLRGRTGTVTQVHEGDYIYFWHTGDGIGDPMPVYIVEFTPTELWGPRAEPGAQTLYAELFEAYLEVSA